MPGIDFQKLRAEVTMEHVLHLLGFKPTRCRGDQWYGACPLHQSDRPGTASFSVNVARGCYYCHKCRSHGNQIKLWVEATKLPIHPAAILLCQQLGKPVPWIQPHQATQNKSPRHHSSDQREEAIGNSQQPHGSTRNNPRLS
jgi:DNA primase